MSNGSRIPVLSVYREKTEQISSDCAKPQQVNEELSKVGTLLAQSSEASEYPEERLVELPSPYTFQGDLMILLPCYQEGTPTASAQKESFAYLRVWRRSFPFTQVCFSLSGRHQMHCG